ncbi:membrane-associated transporter protein [Platysternon megacephalum]|uniref:Membrane-associated transporter protein n=1 Tax=Platysternon megacephalum TaxID=55544 RepID=A0A4D9EYG6_9SAUR|nr:membrane-associated transporter protein [Platysternon megacephalum]
MTLWPYKFRHGPYGHPKCPKYQKHLPLGAGLSPGKEFEWERRCISNQCYTSTSIHEGICNSPSKHSGALNPAYRETALGTWNGHMVHRVKWAGPKTTPQLGQAPQYHGMAALHTPGHRVGGRSVLLRFICGPHRAVSTGL